MNHQIDQLAVRELHRAANYDMRAALDADRDQRYATAACWLEAAADCAVALWALTHPRDPELADAWLAVADHRETLAEHAWHNAKQDARTA